MSAVALAKAELPDTVARGGPVPRSATVARSLRSLATCQASVLVCVGPWRLLAHVGLSRYSVAMILEHRAAPPFFKNGFVLGCEDTREGIIIDPGDDVDELLEAARHHGLSIKTILLTHAHLDHVTGVAKAKRTLGVPVWLHKDDQFLYEEVVQQGLMFGLRVEPQPPIDHFYDVDVPLRFGRYTVRVRHTPGHCPGGVCLAVSRDAAPAGKGREDDPTPVLFVGDTLFAGSIGRTDLPGGNHATLLRSIRDVLFGYPDDTVVWSGHGEQTTVGRERRTNPFLIS
jgi:hydroxyacylglutathione hydrolase